MIIQLYTYLGTFKHSYRYIVIYFINAIIGTENKPTVLVAHDEQ